MTARRAIPARRPQRHGGGACTVLLVRAGDAVVMHIEAVDAKAVELDETAAAELAASLIDLLG